MKLSSPLGPGPMPKTDNVLSGSTFGGVPVTGTITGTSSSGTMTLLADGKVFATGTYTCSSTCSFTGTVAGKTVTGMTLTSSSSKLGTTLSTTGAALSSAFPNHGAWVSAVGKWAKANDLTGRQRGEIVSAAAKIEGPQASGKNTSGSGQGKGKGNESSNGGQGNGDGDGGHGGGGHGKP